MIRRLRNAVMILGCLMLAAGWAEADPRTLAPAAQVQPRQRDAVVQPDRIRQTVARYFEKRFAGKAHDVHITLLDPQEPVAVPPGALELNVLPGALEENVGRRLMRVQILVNGREVGLVETLVEIAAYADVIVAQRLIKPEELIEPEDVAIARIKLHDLKHQFAVEMGDVVGKSAARPIPAHSPVKLSQLKPPYAVRKGDRVIIEAQGGGLSIRTAGITKSGGQVGQYVAVSNVDSGREIKAKVVAPGVVRVDY
ncbi:MAG TPA: flagellar basal body P-ring formation chaperone FlgA [Nitrospiraceae bacterium]|nr:flagellar basal body P-ring formation chaperone FlgA [Nitrospiraceae bacterium]